MKMINLLNILTVLAITFIASSCRTTQRTAPSANYAKSEYNRLDNIVSQHDKQLSSLTFQFNKVKEANSTIIEHINKIYKQLGLANNKIAALQQENQALRNALTKESQSRNAQINQMIQVVAKQTEAAVNSAQRQRSRTTQRSTKNGPATKGEFYEYIVERGATLSAIAKAYHVSVYDIKKANRMKSDNIRVGQKLYIPKK